MIICCCVAAAYHVPFELEIFSMFKNNLLSDIYVICNVLRVQCEHQDHVHMHGAMAGQPFKYHLRMRCNDSKVVYGIMTILMTFAQVRLT